jgi:hypothetical protein
MRGCNPPPDSQKREDHESVDHESDHGRVALAVGAQRVYYGLAFGRVDSDGETKLTTQFFMEPVYCRTTKLGMAAIAAAPTTPEEGDLEELRAMGYEGVLTMLPRAQFVITKGQPSRFRYRSRPALR